MTSTLSSAEVYEFAPKLREGIRYEDEIDRFVAAVMLNKSIRVSRQLQRMGIDRIWQTWDGQRVSVEYKADSTAAKTGNLFIETISVDTAGKVGWAYYSLAQLLVLFIPPSRRLLIVSMMDVKNRLLDWTQRYEQRSVRNKRYHTKGVLVPIAVLVWECEACEYEWPLGGMRMEP